MKSKFTKQLFIIIALISILGLCVSCSKKEKNDDGKIHIMASFYPLYIMLMNITDSVPNVELSMLAPANTGCLHDYQLTTKDMKALERCDIFVANGAGMESFIEKAIQIKEEHLITASDGIQLINDNAHVWVSTDGAIKEVLNITQGLCRLDKNNAELYTQNCFAYIEKLEDLSYSMHQRLDNYSGAKIITFHEAFPYFADEFNLDTVAVVEGEPGANPNAKEIAQIVSIIKNALKENSSVALFAEPQYSSSAAKIIGDETSLQIGELDPCVTGSMDKDSYINAMMKNAVVLENMLGK